MVCCAIAVFLIGQMYLAAEAVIRLLGFKGSTVERPTASDWHWGAAPAQPAPAFRFQFPSFGRRLVAAGAVSALALTTALSLRPSAEHFDLATYLANPAHLCGAFFSAGAR
jgi:hypothetical protein